MWGQSYAGWALRTSPSGDAAQPASKETESQVTANCLLGLIRFTGTPLQGVIDCPQCDVE